MQQLRELKIGDFAGFVDVGTINRESDMNNISDTARWFCVQVRPGCQKRVEMELARLGFRSFYPRTRKWVSHARTKKAVERPILNRYVFVSIDHPRQSFATVNGIFDVECLISNLGRPTPFPAHWVEGLLVRYLKGEWDEIAHGPIPVGARIRIMEGEFDNMLATVVQLKKGLMDLKLKDEKRTVRMHPSNVRAA